MGTFSSEAFAKMGRNSRSSKKRPLHVPESTAPLSPKTVTARSSSSAASCGAVTGNKAKPENRVGCNAIKRASSSFASRHQAMANAVSVIF